MTRVLSVPFSPPGHADPMAALMEPLRARGYHVDVFGEQMATRWRPSGQLPASVLASGDSAAMFRYAFFGSVVDMTHDIARVARRIRADLIVGDVLMPGAGLAAELVGLPWVSLCCSPVPALDNFRTFIPPHAVPNFAGRSTLEELGLPDDGRNLLGRTSPYLHLIPATPRLVGTPRLPEEVVLVGPLAQSPPVVGLTGGSVGSTGGSVGSGRPLVAVTTTTASPGSLGHRAFVQRRFVSVAAEAFDGLPFDGVITDPADEPVPENVRFIGRTPHEPLFDRCAAVVTHSGWGTVSRAMVRGLPLVLVPVAGDQDYIARRCVALGLGIALDGAAVTVAEMRSAIQAVIEEPGYRAAAVELAAEIRALAPLETAAALIDRLLAGEVPPSCPAGTATPGTNAPTSEGSPL